MALGDFRGQIGRRPRQHPRGRHGNVTDSVGDAEVGDLDRAVICEQHIARLDIPALDAHFVCGGQRGGDLVADAGDSGGQ